MLPVDLTLPPEGLSRSPRSVDLSLTGRCNLKCRYCFYADSMAARSDLPTKRWLSFFEELGRLAVQRVTLSGGEVFTRSDLFDLIDGVIENRMRYSILSNGTLITEEVIEALQEGKRRMRMDSIQVSIDGSCAEVHDRSRPPHSFERAVNGLRLLKETHFPVTVRVTLNHHNIDDLEKIAHLLIDDIGLSSFSTNEAEVMGTARCSGESITLSVSERKKAMEVLTRLNDQYGGRIGAQAGPLSRAKMFQEIETRLEKGETDQPGRGTLCSCGGVFSKMAVLHDGTMVPCNMLPTLTMGVIGMHSLQDAWLHSPTINAVRRRREIPIAALEECKDCSYSGFCTGGCPASVMAKSGRLIGIDPLCCYREYLKEEHQR
ncbi:SynChlorMet cassette radical SAM/SPASM protein ScmE [Methanospirillum sp.]